MKKIIATLIAAALICTSVLFAACSKKGKEPSGTEGDTHELIVTDAVQTENSSGTTEEAESPVSDMPSQTPSAYLTETPDAIDNTASSAPDQTPSAVVTENPGATEGGTQAIEDGGDVIITVPSGQTSGGLGGNP